jgi:hypothetical protein
MGSPVKGSILITVAPISASIAAALGAAIQLSISKTTTSSSGAAILHSPNFADRDYNEGVTDTQVLCAMALA